MKPKIFLFVNTLSLLGTLFINYYVGTGTQSGKTIGEVSSQYPTLITPAAYAFSIWGLIYLLLIAFVGYQWYTFLKDRHEDSLIKAGAWFMLANMANGIWVIAWINEALGWSVLIMLVLLIALIILVKRLDLEVWDAPLRIIFFVWWPICVYLGWIILATLTNVAVYLKSQNWLEKTLAPELWAIIAIAIAALIYLFLTYTRNMREAALVGVWGLVAIAFRQWGSNNSVVITALLAAAVLVLYVAYHGYKHKDSSPFVKLKAQN